ncbi:MAG: Uma2 family endonuclease [Isosphaeraceae bacterium]|nr:Uma2 family endonuclease [Isosphaeraceae bacterium]
MSTVDHTEKKTLPPLIAGQRLDRATFHERYEAMPPDTRAELVGGIVYMPSPLGYDHGERDADISDWIGHYKRYTPGVRRALNATTQFDDYGEPQPDLQLRIPEERGGSSRIENGYVVGPPEFVIEVSKTTRKHDLGPKKADYERAGVAEYLFIGLDPQEIRWFIRRGDRFEELPPGADGVYRSEVFPGLWLEPAAFFDEDTDRLFATLDRGLATAEHQAFVARLSAR